MLQLILGTSGSGKSYKIRNIIKEKLSSTKKLMLIVPEQYSFENEKEMLKEFGPFECNKIEVMSFTRLTNFVFKKVGGLSGVRIDDSLRNVLMSLALEEASEQLSLYKEKASSNDLVQLMVSSLKEFKRSSTSIDDLFNASNEAEDEILSQKLKETATVLSIYDSLLSRNYIDPLDDLTWLLSAVKENNFFKDYTVFIDSFNGFTSQEINIIEQILIQCQECFISLCMDDPSFHKNDLDLFSTVYDTFKKILNIAKKNSVKIKPHIKLLEQKRFKNQDLKYLEQNIYRSNYKATNDDVENITIYSASNFHSEASFVSNTIKKLIVEEGYNYKDFAVISRNIENYRGIIDVEFNKNDIPYFLDKAEPIDTKPIIKFVTTAFDIINNSFSTDLIFDYLKTGLTDLNIEEISILENYVFLWDIKGKAFKEEFTSNPNGFSEKLTQDDEELLERINKIKNKTILPLEEFEKRVNGKNTGLEISKAVYKLLVDNNVHDNLFNLYKELMKTSSIAEAQKQLRLWDLFMDILDQMAAVTKQKYLSSQRYLELLRLIIQSNDIAFIPQGLDQVTIGQADRIRLHEPKIVFIIGAIEGEFPKNPISFGIFTDLERKKLIELKIDIHNNLEKTALEERFLTYQSLSSASTKLYISWPSSNVKGNSKKPSSIVKEAKRIFPKLEIKDEFMLNIDQIDSIWSIKSAFEMCAKHYKDDSLFSNSLKKYFEDKDEYQSKLSTLDAIAKGEAFSFKDEKKARKLFGENLKLSASQVEKFYLCKFQYFCKYGLYAKPKKKASFDNLEYGLVMHYILENMFKKYSKDEFCSLGEAEVKKNINDLLFEYSNKKLGGLDNKNSRFKYLFFRLINTATRLIAHLQQEFKQSEFYAAGCEVSVEEGKDIEPLSIKLIDGSVVKVQGKIDRVDVMNKGGRNYIRVIDYKTGKKEFKLCDVLYGLNMQMLIYLTAIVKNSSSKYYNIVPAGILYMPSSFSAVNMERNSEKEKIDKEHMKIFKMNGLILDNPLVIRGMEADAKGVFIPVSLKGDTPSKRDSLLSLSQLGKISKHIESLIESMANELHKGKIEPSPVSGEYDSCKWCEYSSVCGHEKEDKTLKIEKFDNQQAIKEILKKEGENIDEKLDC